MRAVLQRVDWAEVQVEDRIIGRIERGLLAYVGVERGDEESAAQWLARKVAGLRVFEDESSKLNRSVQDVRGGILAVPNFTLLADARKGRRPSLAAAAEPEPAERLFEVFVTELAAAGVGVAKGLFGADMLIRSAAAGPVNLILETPGSSQARREDAEQER